MVPWGRMELNKKAVIESYNAALRGGSYELAMRIMRANPDIIKGPMTEVWNGKEGTRRTVIQEGS